MKENNDYEIEVKFRIADPSAFRNRILALGGQSQGRFFEKNILFDTADQRLRHEKVLLRLRRSETCLLTVKSPAENPDPEFKILKEWETKIDNFETTRKILHVLGFDQETIYEKYRENFFLRDVDLSLDELPFGFFAELEGEKEKIREVASLLGFDWMQKTTENYLDLFRALGLEHPKKFPEEISFSAFRKAFPGETPFG